MTGIGKTLSEAFEEIKRRCEEAGLEYEEDNTLGGERLTLLYPRGRGTARVDIGLEEEAQMLLRQPFETYRGIETFEAT